MKRKLPKTIMPTQRKTNLVHFSNVEAQAVRFGADLVQNAYNEVHLDMSGTSGHIVSH